MSTLAANTLSARRGLPPVAARQLRIAVHDYAGHPFQMELSRTLAARGHTVRHFFFAGDQGPKGASAAGPTDPPTFSIEPLHIALPYSKDRFARRLLGDLLYGHCIHRRIRAFRPDVVISSNTPPDAQRIVARAAASCGAQFVFWVQDFYSVGMERVLAGRWMGAGRLVARRYRALEWSLLKRSHSIVLISPDFRKYLPVALRCASSVHVIRNWGALGAISPAPKPNSWSERHGLSGKFVFMYTGTLGLKHDPKLLLALADAFADDKDVAIVVVAHGVNLEILRSFNETRRSDNLHLLPLQPIEDLPDALGTADVLIALLEQDAAEFSVPSKLLSYLCAGRPVLLSAPTSNLATQVLAESSAGLHAESLDLPEFLASAHRLRQDLTLRRDCGEAGRRYAKAHFDIEVIASKFECAFAPADLRPTDLKIDASRASPNRPALSIGQRNSFKQRISAFLRSASIGKRSMDHRG